MTTKKAKPKTITVTKKKQRFNFSQFENVTPSWAKYAVGIITLLSTAFAGWVLVTNVISAQHKAEIQTALIYFNSLVVGIAAMFGIETTITRKKDESENK